MTAKKKCKTCGARYNPEAAALRDASPEQQEAYKKLLKLRRRQRTLETQLEENVLEQVKLQRFLGLEGD